MVLPLVATVLTVYGIETVALTAMRLRGILEVATVLTVYGIETGLIFKPQISMLRTLQQYLPFTVLKLYKLRYSFEPVEVRCNSTYRLRY